MSASAKNAALLAVADALTGNCGRILEANGRDVSRAQENGMHPGMVDRLRLTEARVEAMAEGLRQIAGLQIRWERYWIGLPVPTVWKSRNAGCRWESLESFMNPVPM